MNRRMIEQWLEAGAPDKGSQELDHAWSELLAELPPEAPSAAFASRVMLRVAEARGAARDLAPRFRFALVACLALIGVAAIAAPSVLFPFPLQVGGLIAALAGGIKVGAAWAARGAAVWGLLANIARTTSVVLATPEATAFLATIALVSAGALRLLFELTHFDRRTADAASR